MHHARGEGPPEPPHVTPRLRMRRNELIGVVLLAVPPLCALFGLFGPASERANSTTDPLRLEVEYPTRLRFHLDERLVMRVTNLGEKPLDTVALTFSESYLHEFSELTPTPDLDWAHGIELKALAPGEVRTVAIELRADRYGVARGEVVATSGRTRAAIPVSTFVFP